LNYIKTKLYSPMNCRLDPGIDSGVINSRLCKNIEEHAYINQEQFMGCRVRGGCYLNLMLHYFFEVDIHEAATACLVRYLCFSQNLMRVWEV